MAMNITMEKILIEKARQNQTPINASFELLPLCNMDCKMCFVRLSHQEQEAIGPLRLAEEWLELARQMAQEGTLFLMLTGGEPLLYPEFRKLYVGLKQMGFVLTINTNGTLIDEGWGDFFAKYPPRRVNITLYGASEETYDKLCHYKGGYEKTIRGVRLLKERGIDVKLNGSLVAANHSEFEQMLQIAKELDCPINVDTYMYPATRERSSSYCKKARLEPKDAAIMLLKNLKNTMPLREFQEEVDNSIRAVEEADKEPIRQGMRCQAGKTSLAINWQGYMRPCVMLSEPSIDVFKVGFKKAWQMLMEETNQIQLCPYCPECRYRRICSICPASCLHESGSYDKVPEYVCEYTKETYKCMKEEWEKMHG